MMQWSGVQNHKAVPYLCGHCERQVASEKGWMATSTDGLGVIGGIIRICPLCQLPTYLHLDSGLQIPGNLPGNAIEHLPDDIRHLYNEARRCFSVSAYTATVMSCRKMLMNIAVTKGAEEKLTFAQYVKYLADKGYVPPDNKKWVEHIREKGNEANHEINSMSKEDAEDLINFLEMLLKLIYEFSGKMPKSRQGKESA